MKKIIYISVLVFFAYSSWAKTIRIGNHQTIKTIQQALPLAENGDTILVDAGYYHEKNIIINNPSS